MSVTKKSPFAETASAFGLAMYAVSRSFSLTVAKEVNSNAPLDGVVDGFSDVAHPAKKAESTNETAVALTTYVGSR